MRVDMMSVAMEILSLATATTASLCGGRGNCIDAIEERLRVFEILCVKTLGKPTIDRREETAGFGAAALSPYFAP